MKTITIVILTMFIFATHVLPPVLWYYQAFEYQKEDNSWCNSTTEIYTQWSWQTFSIREISLMCTFYPDNEAERSYLEIENN